MKARQYLLVIFKRPIGQNNGNNYRFLMIFSAFFIKKGQKGVVKYR